MLDNRIYTFLELCTLLNYHKVAENLSMTQPAVTQHIKYLENLYQCKLFEYANRKLSKTQKGIELERYARQLVSLDLSAQESLLTNERPKINIGATKTIGEYILSNLITSFISDDQSEITMIIDNTENLLNKLNHFELDLLLLEGYVDKGKYYHQKILDKEIIGICALDHPFGDKTIPLESIFNQHILLREKGSGTRNVFEHFLLHQGYSTDNIKSKSIISSNKIIENLVEDNLAISFVYDVIPAQNPKLKTFKIQNLSISHEFNFVFLNQEKANHLITYIQDRI